MTITEIPRSQWMFEKRLGWLNAGRFPPVVEAGGEAWMTRDGVIVMYPDHWEGSDASLKPLPEGVKTVVL